MTRRSMTFVLVLAALAGTALLCASCSTNDGLAGTTNTGNARTEGTLYNSDGTPARQAVVLLIDSARVPSPADAPVDIDTTDDNGGYALSGDSAGAYNIQGVSLVNGERIIIPGVGLHADAVTPAPGGTLRPVGTLRVVLPDSLAAIGTSLGILGTMHAVAVDSASAATRSVIIDSVPDGAIPPVFAGSGATAVRLYDHIVAIAGDTTLVDAAFRVDPATNYRVSTADSLQTAIDRLLAGDTLSIQAGVYALAKLTIANRANALRPILIRTEPGAAVVLRGISASDNLVNIIGAEHVIIDGMEIDATPPGSDAVKLPADGVCVGVVLRNLHIHNSGGIGINSEGNHHDITISGCHIHNTDSSSGIRVGNMTADYQPYGWMIDGNWIHDCPSPASGASYGIAMQLGSHAMTVRNNVIYAAGRGGIMHYGGYAGNADGSSSSIIEGNAVWNVIEGVGAYSDVTVRNNIVFGCVNPVYSYDYAGAPPKQVRIFNNTFYGGTEIYLGAWDSLRVCRFANNAVYGLDSGFTLLGTGSVYGNTGDVVAPGFAAGSAAADLMDPANRNFFPAAGSSLIDAATGSDVALDDFDGRPRDARPDVGAYEYSSSGPAWGISEGFKGR